MPIYWTVLVTFHATTLAVVGRFTTKRNAERYMPRVQAAYPHAELSPLPMASTVPDLVKYHHDA